jgi:hypothetical protein
MPLPEHAPLVVTLPMCNAGCHFEGNKASPLEEEVVMGDSSSPCAAQCSIAAIKEVPIIEEEAEAIAVAFARCTLP